MNAIAWQSTALCIDRQRHRSSPLKLEISINLRFDYWNWLFDFNLFSLSLSHTKFLLFFPFLGYFIISPRKTNKNRYVWMIRNFNIFSCYLLFFFSFSFFYLFKWMNTICTCLVRFQFVQRIVKTGHRTLVSLALFLMCSRLTTMEYADGIAENLSRQHNNFFFSLALHSQI